MFLIKENFKPFTSAALMAVALTLAAVAMRPLERGLAALTGEGELRPEQMRALAGHGNTLAVLGGLRAAVAGGCWLRTNLAWEKCDREATLALIELTVAADERPLYFWQNGARMIAYDMPEWLPKDAPAAVRQQVSLEQAALALRFLEKGLRWHGARADLYVEMANIYLRRLGDGTRAADYYRLAAQQPDAPYYAARIYAELLVQLGRRAEALAWLQSVLPGLPADDPAARRDVVLARIEALTREMTARDGKFP